MLRRVGETVDPKDAMIKIKDASFPAPFASELEYNSPVHGNWNIVHTGMQVPESIQIYVCADNCMRGVVLTAAEMNAADRFSCDRRGTKYFKRKSGRHYDRGCDGCIKETR